jgi:hypothetical protein
VHDAVKPLQRTGIQFPGGRVPADFRRARLAADERRNVVPFGSQQGGQFCSDQSGRTANENFHRHHSSSHFSNIRQRFCDREINQHRIANRVVSRDEPPFFQYPARQTSPQSLATGVFHQEIRRLLPVNGSSGSPLIAG